MEGFFSRMEAVKETKPDPTRNERQRRRRERERLWLAKHNLTSWEQLHTKLMNGECEIKEVKKKNPPT
jgi:hypothetical protein